MMAAVAAPKMRPVSTSSFVTEVLANAGRLEKEDINAKLGKLSRRIDEVKVEVYDSLQKKYVDFNPSMNTALELSGRVKDLSDDMNVVTTKIEQELNTQLNVSTTEFHDLKSQLEESNVILGILDKLVQINDALSDKDKAMKNNQFTKATRSLDLVGTLLNATAEEQESDVRVLKVLQKNYTIQKEKLVHDIGESWSKSVKWILPKEGLGNDDREINGTLEMFLGSDNKENLQNTAQALYDLDLLDLKLKILGERLLKHFIIPIVSYNSASVDIDTSMSTERLVINTSGAKAPVPPGTAFGKLSAVMEFLQKLLTALPIEVKQGDSCQKVPLMKLLGDVIAEKYADILIEECLMHSIPTDNKELSKYKQIISKTEIFEAELAEMQFVSKENKTLSKYVKNVNVLFANKKYQEILVEARSLMTSDIHNMVQITSDVPLGELPKLGLEGSSAKKAKTADNMAISCKPQIDANTFKLPKCKISASVQKLMELAYQTLHEATTSGPECAIQMFYGVRNMFELFMNVVPTYHKKSLAELPQLSALHYNNCMYIAHHLLTLGHQFRPNLPEQLSQGAATFVDQIPKLRRLGTECFLQQMMTQKTQLIDYISSAEGFIGVSEDNNFAKAEKCLKQILHQIQRLSKLWNDVLPANIYFEAIGTLYNSVLVEVIGSITSLDDISSDDANQLNSLLVLLTYKAPELFEIGSGENTKVLLHKYVASWSKSSELMMVVTTGLMDIADRWADGKGPLAIAFTANEVKQMIRALFQNTDRRANILSKIR